MEDQEQTNSKFESLHKILTSEYFKNADETGQEEIIQQIINTGDATREDIDKILYRFNIPYLESLPYDVFLNVILSGNIRGKDIIRLCNSSPKLNEYCNKDYRLKDGRILDQYLFRRLLEKEVLQLESDAFEDYSPRELYKQFAVQDFRDLIYLLEDIESIGKDENHEFTVPKTLQELLYNSNKNKYSSHIPLLKDLRLDPQVPDYEGYLWTKDILENASNIIYYISRILKIETTEVDIRIFAQKVNMTLEQLLQSLIDNRIVIGGTTYILSVMMDNMTNDRNFFNSVHNVLLGYEISYRQILKYSLPYDYEGLKEIIKNKLYRLLNRESNHLGAKYEDDLITKNISQEFKEDKERLEQIRGDLDDGVYDRVIDYLILLHKKIIDGKLSVLTPLDAKYL